MVVHEIASRIPFYRSRLQTTPFQDPSALAIRDYATAAAAVLNAHGHTGDIWAGILRYRAEISAAQRQRNG